MTDQEINEAVAKKLGWVQCCNPKTMENGRIVDCFGWSRGGSHFHEGLPDYCRSLEAAWEIVEKIKNLYLVTIWWHDGEWEVDIETEKGTFKVNDESVSRAICQAFLKLS